MRPSEYLQKWMPIKYGIHPNQRGYKTKAILELEEVTGLSGTSIKKWPNLETNTAYVLKLLDYADLVNSLGIAMKKYKNTVAKL
ncbi:MAG: hypothetical protein F6K24_01645 [Okeania sp. SIO2D1]|uniref:hypothetical protein n=1 Tax=Okeania sp. SIO1I7 TaxID=2607772 RepID=UPI0013B5D58F|nr:hypothetical protein [Okeania sp. SIO1I7]NEN88483.1 hypothetical protein [Okeania sp. SIO3H1]NES64040.1 hypothetical protein [Okeania sp. SIO2D1]NET30245.1 hypothetical protein [Okeania sp. SIO1I7]